MLSKYNYAASIFNNKQFNFTTGYYKLFIILNQ